MNEMCLPFQVEAAAGAGASVVTLKHTTVTEKLPGRTEGVEGKHGS